MSSLRRSGSFLLISLMILVSAAAIDTRRSDVNGNGLVEMGDIDIISQHFNEVVNEPYPPYDVNMDGIVDIGDMTLTGQHFNESIPTSSIISSGDGLKLELGENGTIEGISINDTSLPMLASRGGFSFREVLTSPPNLIANPGFETGAAAPLNWSFVTSSGSTPVWDTISRSGARSIKASISGTTDSRSGYPKSDLIEAEPLAYYTLSAWLKAEGAGGTNAPAVRVVELDSNKKYITQTSLAFGKGTYDWTQKKTTFRTGINTSYLYVYANIWEGYGTFWLDDVELSPFFGPTIYLNGALTQNPDGTVTQRARANDIDFTFNYIPKDRYIELQGEMQDLRGEDRALQVMYNLPVNLTGWNWNDDGDIIRRIMDNSHYEVINKSEPFVSKYSFASIDNGLDKGISIAHNPLSKGYNAYNTKSGYYQQVYIGAPFGIKSNANETNFSMVLYQSNVGFSSTETKYAEIYTYIDKPRINATSPKKIIHATKEDFDAGAKIGVDVLKGGVITLKKKNLLDNPSFEVDNSFEPNNFDGMAENWGIWNPSGGSYANELDQNTSTSGSKSQKINFNSKSNEAIYLIQDLKNVDCCMVYTFSADVKLDNSEDVEVYVALQLWNDTKWLKNYKSDSITDINFTRLTVTSAGTSETDRLKVMVVFKPKFSSANGTLWVDSAQLERGNYSGYVEGYESTNGEYVSLPIDMGELTTPYMFEFTSSVKPEENVSFQIKSADSLEGLKNSMWYGPTSAKDYYAYFSEGENLLLNPSLELDSNDDGVPDYSREIGYGTNDKNFSIVSNAFEGSKAAKVEITNYSNGGERWEILYNGTIEEDTEYVFSVWHKESGDIGNIYMGLGLEMGDGSIVWDYSNAYVHSSSDWKHDRLLFYTPNEIVTKIWLKLSLSKNGWIISDAYNLKKINRSNEWKINSVHTDSKWVQYKVNLSSTNLSYSPSIHDVTIKYGVSVPEIQWINVLDNDGRQKYVFKHGEVANFRVEALDFKGIDNIDFVNVSIINPAGNVVLRSNLSDGDDLSEVKKYYEYQYSFPIDAALGVWKAKIAIINKDGQIYNETVILKVGEPYISPPQKMTLGALAVDYGFMEYMNYNETIETYSKYDGLEIWKLSISWDILEPEHGSFNEEYIAAILNFMDAAQNMGAKVQIGIAQQWWPKWVNNGNWDNERYGYETTMRLADTWVRLGNGIKDHPAFDSYLIINEENNIYDADVYLRGLTKITSSIRSIDGDLNHRITIRPNTVDSYVRTRIAQGGIQDYEYGAGGYPTSYAWWLNSYESPVSNSSYLRMSRLRSSPLAYGGAGGAGEIGFMKASNDSFGDEEKLSAFERAMSIAYDQGIDEFMSWEGSFSFKNPEVYFSKLKDFKDNLILQPRSNYFNVRVLIDNNDWLYKEPSQPSSKLNMSEQPYLFLIKTLDENGYTWFYTHSDAEILMNVSFNTTIKLSEIKGKNESEQNKIISEKLWNITHSGKYYPWPNNGTY